MALIVQKYGGSSLADVEKIKKIASRIIATKDSGNEIVVVVSAQGDTTDELIELAHEINEQPAEREMDMLLSTGEQVSAALLTMAIHAQGRDATSFTGTQVGIATDSSHTKAKILKVDAKRIKNKLEKGHIVIVTGFQGADYEGNITTLGRGGSDLTAVSLAAVLNAQCCEICTDVEGVYTADPRVVPEARKLDVISYDEMLEMASLGARVLHNRSVEMAKRFAVPLHVCHSFSLNPGTLITKEDKSMEDVLVSGVTLSEEEAKVSLCGVPDKPGVAAKLFQAIANANISVDMIVQNMGKEGLSDISFTVAKEDIKKAIAVVEKISRQIGDCEVIADDNIAKVSVVGIGMGSHSGVATGMFTALAKEGINIQMISTSEIKISCIISKKNGKKAMRAIHKKFKLGRSIGI
jgi:aspartate kinase